jgi:uncharacterized membrane protein (UPF0127 family)
VTRESEVPTSCGNSRGSKRVLSPLTAIVQFTALILLAACAPTNSSNAIANTQALPAATAIPDLPTAITQDGSRVTLELAVTSEEIGRGMMFRPSLPDDRGMLFLFSEERLPSFWMKNTIVPLDLVFFDNAGHIVDVIKNAQPCAAEPCPQYIPSNPARAVLEIAAGNSDRLGLRVGDVVTFERVDGYPDRSTAQIDVEE